MIFNFKYIEEDYAFTYPKSIVTLENQPVENVMQFRYLGDEVKYNELSTGDAEVELRITAAQAKFYEILKKLTNMKIRLSTRVLILNSLVRSRLTYSCQTWNLTEVQMQKINSTYVTMLRKLVRNGCRRDKFRYVMSNDEILETCKTTDIKSFVSKQQASYLGHLARQQINKNNQSKDQFYREALKKKKKGHDHQDVVDCQMSSQ